MRVNRISPPQRLIFKPNDGVYRESDDTLCWTLINFRAIAAMLRVLDRGRM